MAKPPLLKTNLEKLYNSGLSMFDISLTLNCSVHKVVYWMDKYDLKRRDLSNALYLKLNPNGDPFKIKTIRSKNEEFLHGMGLGIYWGEGEKISKGGIRVTNTDPKMLKIFRDFLIKICQVRKEKLLYSIICFNDSNPVEAKKYWANQLEISEDKFGKIVQIPKQGKGTYRKKSRFGVCTVVVSNIKLKKWLMSEIAKI